MSWLIPIFIIAFIILFFIIRLKQPSSSPESCPYIKNTALFSPAERSFLGVLEQAVGDEYRIFGKVRVADVASVKSMSNKRNWYQAFNRISAKHFDFLLCAKGDLSITCAVELDDKSHQQHKRQERDAFLVGVCQSISLPLIQIQAQAAYSVAEVRAKIVGALGQQEAIALPINNSSPVENSEPSQSIAENQEQQLQAKVIPVTPTCTKCASPMVQRQAKSGTNAGEIFWGCSAFPKCRNAIRISA